MSARGPVRNTDSQAPSQTTQPGSVGPGPRRGDLNTSPGHAQRATVCQEPTAARGPGYRAVGLRSGLPPPSWALPHLLYSKARTPLLEPRRQRDPRARATHLSGPEDSGCTPPRCSPGGQCRLTVQGMGRAGSRRLGPRRGCRGSLASSAHRTGPPCGGRTDRPLRARRTPGHHRLSPSPRGQWRHRACPQQDG